MAEYGADMWRACVLVVALLITAAPANASACQFRAADTQNEDYATVQALKYLGGLVDQCSGGRLKIPVFHSRQLRQEETIEHTRGGVIDINRCSFMTSGHNKRAGFYTLAEQPVGREVPLISMEARSGLSDGEQIIFREAAAASSRFMRQKWRDLAQRSRGQAEDAGITVIKDFERKPFEAAMASIHEAAWSDPAAAALIDCIRNTEWTA